MTDRIDTIPRGLMPALAKDEDQRARAADPATRERIDAGISARAQACRTAPAEGLSAKNHNLN